MRIFQKGDKVRIRKNADRSSYARRNQGLITTIFSNPSDSAVLKSEFDEKLNEIRLCGGVWLDELEFFDLEIFGELGD